MEKIRTHASRALDEMGIPYQVLRHDHKAKNVEEAAAERGVPVQQIVKTLLVRRPDRRHLIALVRGDQRLSLKKLARLTKVKTLEMAPEADVSRITGYQIGAVARWACAVAICRSLSITTYWSSLVSASAPGAMMRDWSWPPKTSFVLLGARWPISPNNGGQYPFTVTTSVVFF